jgi:hypothetical protein
MLAGFASTPYCSSTSLELSVFRCQVASYAVAKCAPSFGLPRPQRTQAHLQSHWLEAYRIASMMKIAYFILVLMKRLRRTSSCRKDAEGRNHNDRTSLSQSQSWKASRPVSMRRVERKNRFGIRVLHLRQRHCQRLGNEGRLGCFVVGFFLIHTRTHTYQTHNRR